MRLLLFLFLVLAPVQSQNAAVTQNHPAEAHPGQQAMQPLIASPSATPQRNSKGTDNQRGTDSKSSDDTAYLILTGIIALATIFQAFSSWRQGKTFEKQYNIMSEALIASNASAEAANRSAESSARGLAALEKLERPFLMIELRGTDQYKDEIWIVNKGKVPAQIIWWNPSGSFRIQSHEEMENMPPVEEYNYGYLHDAESALVINVPWIASEAEIKLTNFDWITLEDEIKAAYQNGQKHFYLLSSVKYRGILTDAVFESRYCCRWYGRQYGGLRLDGPYGYNSYTQKRP